MERQTQCEAESAPSEAEGEVNDLLSKRSTLSLQYAPVRALQWHSDSGRSLGRERGADAAALRGLVWPGAYENAGQSWYPA